MKSAKLAGTPKKNKKKVIWIIVILIIVLAAGGAALWFFFGKKAGKDEKRQAFGANGFGNFSSGNSLNVSLQGKVTASGVTNVGTVSETFDVTDLETELRIEKVYVASGDDLETGDKILKLTEESIENARKELQEKERDAELSYRTGAIEYERSKIAAEYDRDSTKLSGTQADGVYQDSLLDVAQDLETAQSKLDEAKAQIQKYATFADADACQALMGCLIWRACRTSEEACQTLEEACQAADPGRIVDPGRVADLGRVVDLVPTGNKTGGT